MITLPANIRIYAATSPVDFRRGFDGLCAIVTHSFGQDIVNGDIFVFINKRANQIRLLFWDRDGLCLVSKRLEKGTFRRVKAADGTPSHVEIDTAQLMLLLGGIDVSELKRRKRFTVPKKAA